MTSKCEELGEAEFIEKAAETAARRRKRKFCSGESELDTCSIKIKTRSFDVTTPDCSVNSECESVDSDHALASCCSSSKSVDLEENELIATSGGEWVDSRDRKGTTPSSEVHVQSGELESTERPPDELNSLRRTEAAPAALAAMTPTEAVLEEFFSAAEKNMQKQFIDKYNYDIVKDEPLTEGRYEWVPIQLKP